MNAYPNACEAPMVMGALALFPLSHQCVRVIRLNAVYLDQKVFFRATIRFFLLLCGLR